MDRQQPKDDGGHQKLLQRCQSSGKEGDQGARRMEEGFTVSENFLNNTIRTNLCNLTNCVKYQTSLIPTKRTYFTIRSVGLLNFAKVCLETRNLKKLEIRFLNCEMVIYIVKIFLFVLNKFLFFENSGTSGTNF